MIKLKETKEDVNIKEMYGIESTLSREEFLQKYKIKQSRTFK